MTDEHANNLIEAAHGVRAAIDDFEGTDDIAGLTAAVAQACDRLKELNDAAGQITHYPEALVKQAKKELGTQ